MVHLKDLLIYKPEILLQMAKIRLWEIKQSDERELRLRNAKVAITHILKEKKRRDKMEQQVDLLKLAIKTLTDKEKKQLSLFKRKQ